MTNKMNKIAMAFALCGSLATQAQDGHLSHYDAAPALLNPALTGMYSNADFRMTSNVRSQWNSLSSSFTTTGFGYDVAMQDRYGVGMYLNNYNMAGIMNSFQSGLSAAYNVAGRGSRYILSGGFNVGVLYKKLNDQQLVWDAQYDNGYFNTDLPSGEIIQRGSRLMLDIAGGIAYKSTNARKRVNPFANFAMYHVNTPNESILRTSGSDLPIRFSLNAGARVEVMENTFISPSALYMRQGADQQVNVGVMSEIGLGGTVYSVLAGVAYRLNDAIIGHAGLKHKNVYYRFSYDANMSSLQNYTRKNGAFEFSLVYYGLHSGRDRRATSSAF